MITKNDEEYLDECLKSCAAVFDEIILVDMGSSDKTVDIARKYTGKIYEFEWADDFSAARNFSFSKASCEYIMWLNADDVILPSDLYQLKILKKVLSRNIDIVMMNYNVGTDNGGHPAMSYYRERLLKKSSVNLWKDPVYEYIPLTGKVSNADISITHRQARQSHSDLNLEIFQGMITRGTPFSSRNTLYYARELRSHNLISEATAEYEKYLSLEDGWIEDYLSACFELSQMYQAAHNEESMIEVLLRSLKYAKPGAEICCQIGEYHFMQKAYREAAFWYDLALKPETSFSWRLVYEDYRGYIPALQLCLCYYYLGDVKKAMEYNLIAKKIKPNDPSVLTNEKFFATLKQ